MTALGRVARHAPSVSLAPVQDRSRSYPGTLRLKRRADFLAVQGRGRKIHTPHFVVCLMSRAEGDPRLGITVTKKVAGAVGRNRVKRILREVFRCNRSQFPPSTDVVVVAKDGAPLLSRGAVESELLGALTRRRRT